MGQLPLFNDDGTELTALKENDVKKINAKKYISSIWSFPNSTEDQLYRWYGTLPKPLVERLVTMYATDNSKFILDPFMGLGTTLDVALDAHVKAKGIDSNPLSCLTTEVRLLGLPTVNELNKALDTISKNLSRLNPDNTKSNTNEWQDLISTEKYSYTQKWFRKDTLNAILALLFQIAKLSDIRIQRLFFVVTSQIIRDVASVDPRCTHHLVTKKKPFIDPLPLLKSKVSQSLSFIRSKPVSNSEISITQGSILNSKIHKEKFGFAIVHPPYLGVIHYHLMHRLATDLLDIVNIVKSPKSLQKYDFDYDKIKSSDVSTDNTEKYQNFVENLSTVLNDMIIDEGRCAIIIGDQRHKQHLRHPFTDFIYHFEKNGFMLEEVFVWILQNKGGMHVLRRGHFIDHNYVLVFHKLKNIK